MVYFPTSGGTQHTGSAQEVHPPTQEVCGSCAKAFLGGKLASTTKEEDEQRGNEANASLQKPAFVEGAS